MESYNRHCNSPAEVAPGLRELARQLFAAGVREVVTEYEFDRDRENGRRWRHDLFLPGDPGIAIECEGGVGTGRKSRHTTYGGFREDCEKYATSMALHGNYIYRTATDATTQRTTAKLVIAHLRRLGRI